MKTWRWLLFLAALSFFVLGVYFYNTQERQILMSEDPMVNSVVLGFLFLEVWQITFIGPDFVKAISSKGE